MVSSFHRAAIALLIAALPLTARAVDPADPAVSVPQPEYRSAFSGYRKAGFDEKRDWREANDTVRALGGHAGALKDGPAAEAAPAAPSMPGPMMPGPMMHGPHGHGPGGQRQ
ncbi:MAG: hypothetical protein OJJ21_13570 [Ferrovibrio sp.]|uniref:hypothetical protein n=1 Tax=Ferrovibrio sp. TaxID=1917215 RepID=UPI00260EBB6B|nr:hypothetical protein [Ferrovibrio sp.]MCW0234624.1 hypothetical protein [Ferrovibrio sp.]